MSESGEGSDAGSGAAVPTGIPYPSSRSSWFAVAVLMVIYIFSFVDRTILNLLVEPIKAENELLDGAEFCDILYVVWPADWTTC